MYCKNEGMHKQSRILQILGIVMLLSITIIFGGCNANKGDKGNSEIKLVSQKMEVSQEQANEIVYAAHEIGIAKIENIKHNTSLDKDGVKVYYLSGLWGDDKFSDFVAEIKDGSVLRLFDTYQQVPHFLYVNGEYLGKMADYRLTDKEWAHLVNVSESTVKNLLKSPDSADFAGYDSWAYSKESDKIIVQSYVDAPNSYGAKIRNKFWITFSSDMQNIVSVNINGQEMIK